MKTRPGTMKTTWHHKNQHGTLKTRPRIMKNKKNLPGIMRNQPGTIKTGLEPSKNQPGTMKNHEKP